MVLFDYIWNHLRDGGRGGGARGITVTIGMVLVAPVKTHTKGPPKIKYQPVVGYGWPFLFEPVQESALCLCYLSGPSQLLARIAGR